MKEIPKQVRVRLEAMSLTDLDVLGKICGRVDTDNMRMRVSWITTVITERVVKIFDIKE